MTWKSEEEEPTNEEDKQSFDDVEYNADLYIYNQLTVHDWSFILIFGWSTSDYDYNNDLWGY